MEDRLSRTKLLYGDEAIDLLKNKKVAIFGIGGVGGYVCEALARTGVGKFLLVDNDVINESNINRQIIATYNTISQYKVDVMKERILSINLDAIVDVKKMFVLPDNINELDFGDVDYIVDAIDTVKAKIALVGKANEYKIPMISSMGTGNKFNPMGFIVADINKTEMDPLAKVMRQELRKRGIKHLKVVFSKEEPVKTSLINEETKKAVPGSNAFVPSAAGLLIASEVIKDLISKNE